MSMTSRLIGVTALWLLLGSWSGAAWALPHPYFSKHPDKAKKLEALLQQTSLKALEPQPADLEIQLMDLKGQAQSLAQYRGQAMILTRWATWCGACKAEMPFKLKLKQALASHRLALIGISDESKETVADYEQGAPNRYPISLLDPKGLMQKFFPGGAIPVTIIVDPWGWVLAMKTGGDRWDSAAYQALFRFLISLAPSKAALQKKEKAPAPKVSFARKIEVKAGQTFAVSFAMRWLGERDKYTRLLFRLPKEKGLRVLGVSTSGISEDKDGNQRKYILRLKAVKAGEYQLDPILLTYWLKDYDSHFQVPVGKLDVKVASLLGPSSKGVPTWALGTLGAAGLLLLLLIIVAVGRANAQKNQGDPGANAKAQQQKAALEAGLKALLKAHNEEDWGLFLTTSRSLWKDGLDDADSDLNELEEAHRYGGQAPSRDQIASVVQRLYQALRDVSPDHAARLKELR